MASRTSNPYGYRRDSSPPYSPQDGSFNSTYRSSSGIDTDSDEENSSPNKSLNLTHEIDVVTDKSPVRVSRSELRKRDTVQIQNRSMSGSPRPKRRSPRLAEKTTSPATSSPEILREALKKGRGATRKPGVGSTAGVTVRRPIHPEPGAAPITNTGGGNNLLCVFCCIGILVIVAIIFFVNPVNKETPVMTSSASKGKKEVILEALKGELDSLRQRFPQQDRRFWNVISAAVKRVLQSDNPRQPAVLMLVSTTENDAITECLGTHITDAIRKAHSHNESYSLKVDSSDLVIGKTPDELKVELDNMLTNSFEAGHKAALFYNIQDLPSKTAMLFHSYCDNDNAPFKDITITFTVKMNGQIKTDEDIEQFFYSVWADLDKDTLSPLLSRIANSIAIVKKENIDVVKENCN